MKEKTGIFNRDLTRALGFLRDKTLRYFVGIIGFTLLFAVFSVIRAKAVQYMVNAAIDRNTGLFNQTLIVTAVCFFILIVLSPFCIAIRGLHTVAAAFESLSAHRPTRLV